MKKFLSIIFGIGLPILQIEILESKISNALFNFGMPMEKMMKRTIRSIDIYFKIAKHN